MEDPCAANSEWDTLTSAHAYTHAIDDYECPLPWTPPSAPRLDVSAFDIRSRPFLPASTRETFGKSVVDTIWRVVKRTIDRGRCSPVDGIAIANHVLTNIFPALDSCMFEQNAWGIVLYADHADRLDDSAVYACAILQNVLCEQGLIAQAHTLHALPAESQDLLITNDAAAFAAYCGFRIGMFSKCITANRLESWMDVAAIE